MAFEKLPLFSTKREFFYLLTLFTLILSISLFFEYKRYKELAYFDYTLAKAKILKQYIKTKTYDDGSTRRYHIVKCKSEDGSIFYTIRALDFAKLEGHTIELMLWPQDLDFASFMQSYFGYSRIIHIDYSLSLRQKLAAFIEKAHEDPKIATLYKALYLALPMTPELYREASNLGDINHIFLYNT